MAPKAEPSDLSLTRRTLLKGILGVAVATSGAGAVACSHRTSTAPPPDTGSLLGVPDGDRVWLGRSFWGNRLQDWQAHQGRIECVPASGGRGVRSVGVLTRALRDGTGVAHLEVRTGTLRSGGGFSGFLVGAGAGAVDYRAAALVQGASGAGGGLLCVYEDDGNVSIREHTDENHQFAYAPLARSATAARSRAEDENVVLALDVVPDASGFTLTMTAHDDSGVLATCELRQVEATSVTGGIGLVSGSDKALSDGGGTYWFSDFAASGDKITEHDDRALGPLLGSLHSLNGNRLKMTAQLFPIGDADPRQVRLDWRAPGTTTWTGGVVAEVGDGYAGQLRVDSWDPAQDWEYQLTYAPGTEIEGAWTGLIRKDPGTTRSLVVGAVNCVAATHRQLDAVTPGTPKLPDEPAPGLYTTENLYFPFADLVGSIRAQNADLLVALGDQYYETTPTEKVADPSPKFDSLYKYFLWLWAFRDLTASTPCVVLVDDHDMYQGNLWGHGGEPAPDRKDNSGGYVRDPIWINMMQDVQCGHNPDPYDAAPVAQGISVYYGRFTFGGTEFAMLEDRKWKSGSDTSGRAAPATGPSYLLGERQEAFLSDFGAGADDRPRVVLTQTMWVCLETGPDGSLRKDPDTNGFPPEARTRGVELVKKARALMLSGDTHLGALVRQGASTYDDGPLQFSVPAGATNFQRWFEPREPLPNGNGFPSSGNFTDPFGNKAQVISVANPKVPYAQVTAAYGEKATTFSDRKRRSDGYGIVRVDHDAKQFVLECWPRDGDPHAPDTKQPAGWPHELPFDQA